MLIVIYQDSSIRARVLCEAMARSIVNDGHRVRVVSPRDWRGIPDPDADGALFYGLKHPLRDILNAYAREGRPAIFMDLGYWGRKPFGNELEGYHRFVIGDYHPQHELFETLASVVARYSIGGAAQAGPVGELDRERAKKTRAPRVVHKRHPLAADDAPTLVVGMSAKAAWVYDLAPQEWENKLIKGLREHAPDAKIVYRPKPSWKDATPIDGAAFDPTTDIDTLVKRSWRVVTHHSNVCVECAVHDVACWSETGPGSILNYPPTHKSTSGLDHDVRQAFVDSLSHFQYNVAEMRDGTAWRFLKDVYIPLWQSQAFDARGAQIIQKTGHRWGHA